MHDGITNKSMGKFIEVQATHDHKSDEVDTEVLPGDWVLDLSAGTEHPHGSYNGDCQQRISSQSVIHLPLCMRENECCPT